MFSIRIGSIFPIHISVFLLQLFLSIYRRVPVCGGGPAVFVRTTDRNMDCQPENIRRSHILHHSKHIRQKRTHPIDKYRTDHLNHIIPRENSEKEGKPFLPSIIRHGIIFMGMLLFLFLWMGMKPCGSDIS